MPLVRRLPPATRFGASETTSRRRCGRTGRTARPERPPRRARRARPALRRTDERDSLASAGARLRGPSTLTPQVQLHRHLVRRRRGFGSPIEPNDGGGRTTPNPSPLREELPHAKEAAAPSASDRGFICPRTRARARVRTGHGTRREPPRGAVDLP